MFSLAEKIRKVSRNQGGFTLIELLVVVAIIAILAAVLLPKLLGYTNNARVSRAMGDLASMRSVIEAWAADVSGGQGSYPDESNIATVLNDKGIRWGGITDPWGQPYVYYIKKEGNNITGYAIVSYGADKALGGNDDVYVCDHTSPEKGTTDWLAEQGYEEASRSNG
ncbi:prepilin-type N-terminal cleavage/methylation domain-containing protein [Desulfofundulus sp. TPOSR]|nr:prepilin-type N-terminal cleavage/methylation domain-containing protein [Desulfofundulus sp. TPOSR]